MSARDATVQGLLGSLRRQVTGAVRDAVRLGRLPTVPVAVSCPAPAGTEDRPALQAQAAAAVADMVRERLQELGVPGRPVVTVAVSEQEPDRLGVSLHDRPCRLREPRLREALAAIDGFAGSLGGLDGPTWVAAAVAACHVGIECDPSVLVGPGQRELLLARARAAGARGYDDGVLAAAMEQVVANGISLADTAALAGALATTEPCRGAAELAELMIEGLRPRSSALFVPEATLRRATAARFDPGAFADLRLRLFSKLGVHFPDLEVVGVQGQPEGTCALRLNHVTTRPVTLPTETTVDDLVGLIEARFKEHASWFVALGDVQRVVRELRLAAPELVNTVREQYSWPQLASMGRTLIEEAVPVRNAARLLVLLLDAPAPGQGRDVVRLAEPHRRAADGRDGQPSPRQMVAWSRQQIGEELARTTSEDLEEMVVDRLPSDLEDELDRLASPRPPASDQTLRLLAVRLLAVADRHAATGHDIVVSTQRSREVVRDLLARQYPEVAVRASEEFPPWTRLADRA